MTRILKATNKQYLHERTQTRNLAHKLSGLSRAIDHALGRHAAGAVLSAAAGLALALAPNPALAATIQVAADAVTLDASDGLCSLTEAVQNANGDDQSGSAECPAGSGPDTLILPAGSRFKFNGLNPTPFPGRYASNALPLVTSNITIAGNGSFIRRNTTGQPGGQPGFRLLEVTETGSLTLSDATISGGRAANGSPNVGGGIFSAGELTLVRVTVRNNRTNGAVVSFGGGIANWEGELTMIDSIVTGNKSAAGGGIFNMGNLYMTGSTVSDNTGWNYAGGIMIFDWGEYAATDPVTYAATLIDSTISGNRASYHGDVNRAGGIFIKNARASLHRVTISNNSALEDGGGLGVLGQSYVSVTHSTIVGNTADNGDGGGVWSYVNFESAGGDDYEAYLKIHNSTITGNTAGNRGGGVITKSGDTYLFHDTITGNSAAEGGGVVSYLNAKYRIRAYIDDSIIADNTNGDLKGFPNGDGNRPGFVIFSHNVFGDVDASTVPGNYNMYNVDDPGLAPLDFNGGPTQTHALCTAAGVPHSSCAGPSPALDFAVFSNRYTPDADQRGVPEPMDSDGNGSSIRDSGSFEAGAALDLGDAPDAVDDPDTGADESGYPTLLAHNGAAHVIDPAGPVLGTAPDAEADGQPSPLANGDDSTGSDDEDGVNMPAILSPGQNVDGEVQVIAGNADGLLNAWIDFNADGDWADAGEQIADDLALPVGSPVNLLFQVPADAVLGDTFARFRISSAGGDAPTGVAVDGEVEDLPVEILTPLDLIFADGFE